MIAITVNIKKPWMKELWNSCASLWVRPDRDPSLGLAIKVTS
jgi:hypothetical protein